MNLRLELDLEDIEWKAALTELALAKEALNRAEDRCRRAHLAVDKIRENES